MAQAQVPEVRWAQRSSESEHEKNLVFLTIVTPDIVKPEISIQAKKIVVKGADKHGKTYNLDLDLYAEIEPESTKQRNTDLNLFFVLQKKEDKVEFWPRLSAGKEKLHNVRTDFDKWVDEDEQEEQPEMPDMGGMGGPDMASMMGGAGGAGGAGGMGGLDFSKLAGMGGAGAGGQPDFAEMMKSMGGGAGFGGGAAGGEDEDEGDSDDDMPALEEVKE